MSNFCVKCGKPLTDGVPCDCEGTVQNNAQTAGGTQQPVEKISETVKNTVNKIGSSNVAADAVDIFKNVINIYKSPESVMKKQGNVRATLVMLAIQSLAIFLVIATSINRLMSAAIPSYLRSSAKDALKIPADVYVKLLLITVLVCAAFYLIFVVASLLVFKLGKKQDIAFKDAFSKFAYVMLPPTLTIVAAWLGSYVHYFLFLGILMYGLIHYFIFVYRLFKENSKASDNFLNLTTPLVIMVTVVIGTYLIGKIVGMFIPEDIMSGLSGFSSLNLF